MEAGFDVQAWQLWLAAGIVLAIAEVLGTQFVLLALGVAFALTALVTRLFGLDLDMQLVSAAVWTAALLPVFIIYYRRHMMPVATRALVSDGLGVGDTFAIVRRGERVGVKIQGDFFPVEPAAGLEEGDRVVIKDWRGICAVVERAPASAA